MPLSIKVKDGSAHFKINSIQDFQTVISVELLEEISKSFKIATVIDLHQDHSKSWQSHNWSLKASDGHDESKTDCMRKRLILSIDQASWHLEPLEVLELSVDAADCLDELNQ